MALEIKQCILTSNDCFKQGKMITPAGIVVHSTGANNPNLKRYVQPDDGVLGDNPYDNDWNRAGVSKCVHAFIGKDKNGTVRVYQTLPWDYRCWGCGSGSKGSYNNNFIQFEICEDSLTDSTYFNTAFNLAMELCAYLVKLYNIPTKNVVSHKEAHKLGYASNHGDCDHWLKKFGKNMDWFRDGVDDILNPPVATPVVYTRTQFIKDIQTALKLTPTGVADNNLLTKTITVSAKKNSRHAIVKPLQNWFNAVGYNCGTVDGIAGAKFTNAVNKYQTNILKYKKADGEITAKKGMWKSLLGLDVVTTNTTTTTQNVATVPTTKYFAKYTGTSGSITSALKAIGAQSSYTYRAKIAKTNNIKLYVGTAKQNTTMVNLLKEGKLIMP